MYLAGASVCVCAWGGYLSHRQLFNKGACRSLWGSNYSFGWETIKRKMTEAKSTLPLVLEKLEGRKTSPVMGNLECK